MASSLVQGRDVVEQADKIKTTLSSWDNCMAETYCVSYPSNTPLFQQSLTALRNGQS